MNIDKKYLKAIIGIALAFSIGLIFFFIFSASYGDGLERVMENAGVKEGKILYKAPLNYGNNYFSVLLMGFVGFFIILFIICLYGKLLRNKNET